MRTAAAYIRVSTDDQLEFSPDSQLKALKNYAEKNNILLPSEFVFLDEGISGRNAQKRPAFNSMIALAKSQPKPFDTILVWKYSRFARNREDSVVYKSMLRKDLGIDVVSISEDVGDDKMSILFEAMIEAMDEYYSINLAEEVKRGMTEKAKRGGVLSGPPFGYEIKEGKYIIIPEEAEILRKVFYDYINGKGFLSIAKELNSIGVTTHKGNKIENRTIEYWLNNPVYVGKMRWNPDGKLSRNYRTKTPIIADGAHEAVVDMDTWKAAQEKMKKQKEKYCRYSKPGNEDLSHWLIGVARCEKCGSVLANQSGHLACSKRGKGLCAGNGYISTKKLENIVLSTLSKVMLPDAEIQMADKSNKESLPDVDALSVLETQIKRLEIKLSRVKAAYENGIDTLEEYKENKTLLLKEIKSLKEELDKENKMLLLNRCKKEEGSEEKKLLRLNALLSDSSISNFEKNKVTKSVFKSIIKGGEDGKTIKFVFWRH